MIYRHIQDGTLWEANDDGGFEVRASRQGGGMVYVLPRHIFEDTLVPVLGDVDMYGPFRASHVTTESDGDDPPIPCFLNQQRWNGWETPYFTYATVMDTILCMFIGPNDRGWYDVNQDTFFLHFDGHAEDEIQSAKGQDIVVGGVTHRVYQVGDGWTWDEVEPAT